MAVQYKMYITVDKAEQNVLLMAAENLKKAKTASAAAKKGADQLNEILQTEIPFSPKSAMENKKEGVVLPKNPVWAVFDRLNMTTPSPSRSSASASASLQPRSWACITTSA